MTPDDIRAAVEAGIRQGLSFPWWSYLAALLISLGGAYLGAYVRRKAEDRATQENFQRLREQLRKTTQDAEEIKVLLSRKNWLTQRQWSVREQHYMALLSNLTKLKLSLQDRDSYFTEPGSEHNQEIPRGENFQSLASAGYQAYQAVRELIGPASVSYRTPRLSHLKSSSVITGVLRSTRPAKPTTFRRRSSSWQPPTRQCLLKRRRSFTMFHKAPNRVRAGLSPALPTPPTVRVRSGPFIESARADDPEACNPAL